MQTVRRLMALALFVGLFIVTWRFAARNGSEIQVDLLFLQIPAVSTWAALLSAFGVGALSAALALGYQVVKKNLVARRYRRMVGSLEAEIHQLRNLPLAGTDSALAPRADAEDRSGGIARRSA